MTAAAARITTLDIVRGVAVMGILQMNIVAFAMPEAAYQNPAAYGGATGINLAAWAINFVLVDSKMRGLFSFLFGASMLLVIERAEARGDDPARVHFARMAWLFVIGLAHLLLIWWGDILTHYALVGVLAWSLRGLSPRRLVVLGTMLIAAEALLVSTLPPAIQRTEHAVQTRHADAATIKRLEDYRNGFGIPSPETIATDLAEHRGDYATVVAARIRDDGGSVVPTLLFVGLETLGFMAFGMAALKSGMLRGQWPARRYALIALAGFGIGIPANAALAWYVWAHGFSLQSVAWGTIVAPVPFRPPMIAAWASLIILATRQGGWLTRRIAAAGRMAFSNYLGTSIICTTVFYGYGLGWYGALSRAQLYLVVPVVWMMMLAWSQPWLDRHAYGPAEWLWRSLARARPQPWRHRSAVAEA